MTPEELRGLLAILGCLGDATCTQFYSGQRSSRSGAGKIEREQTEATPQIEDSPGERNVLIELLKKADAHDEKTNPAVSPDDKTVIAAYYTFGETASGPAVRPNAPQPVGGLEGCRDRRTFITGHACVRVGIMRRCSGE